MVRGYITSAFASALLLGLTTAALAVSGEFNNMCAEGSLSARTSTRIARSTVTSRATPTALVAIRPRRTS